MCQRAGGSTQQSRPSGPSQAVQGAERGLGELLQGWKYLMGKHEEMTGKGPPTPPGTPVAGKSGRVGVGWGEGSNVGSTLGMG